MKYLQSFCFFGLLLFAVQLQAQSPYTLNWKKDGGLVALAGVSSGLGLYLRANLPDLTVADIETSDKNQINSFDRFATKYYSPKADKASDVFWVGTHVFPFLFLAHEKSRKDIRTIAALYGETFFITTGITLLVKTTVKRNRPFVYNSDAPLAKKTTRNARTAFFSGHTSISATNTFFAAKVFTDYYPDSQWKPVVWTTAAIIPAITGYLRIRAGKHFLTDTLTGYALGAAVGVLIPHLHKKKMEKVSFYSGPSGMLVQVRF
ncbi:MAG: phosphatase PAP2 family protein [Saprospiraceae bacterium]